MFNLFPGQGLGFQANKNMAFGLGYITGEVITPPEPPYTPSGGKRSGRVPDFMFYDNGYYTLHKKLHADDEEVAEIITMIASAGVLDDD